MKADAEEKKEKKVCTRADRSKRASERGWGARWGGSRVCGSPDTEGTRLIRVC